MSGLRFDIITLFPDMFTALKCGITGRACQQKLIEIYTWNPREYTTNPHKNVDDSPYGGGPGMVMQYEPLHNAIQAAKQADSRPATVIYLSPQGIPFTHAIAHAQAAHMQRLILIAGRYEGIDERVIIQDVDVEWSVGDYVLSGGEIPAMTVVDAITRLLPNALGDPASAAQDSFEDNLLDHPHYTRPETIDGLSVPMVLQSGNHQAIADWRYQERLRKTWQKRPDLLKRRTRANDEEPGV